MTELERLGAAVGVIMRHGMLTVNQAAQACRDGKATPAQQKIVAELLDAIGGVR